MLYYLFEILEKEYQLMGASLFQYISFRSAISFIFSLLISTIFGKKIINFLRKKQIGDNTRELNLPGEKDKEGTPTMGGLIILLSTIIPILLFSDFKNIYILILTYMISSCYGEKKSLADIKGQIKINETKNIVSILSS